MMKRSKQLSLSCRTVVMSHGGPKVSPCTAMQYCSLRKQAYSNTLKILPPKKNEKVLDKNSNIHISAQKHRLWVLVRTASLRRF